MDAGGAVVVAIVTPSVSTMHVTTRMIKAVIMIVTVFR